MVFERPVDDDHWLEPELGRALAALSERQRTSVLLVHCFGWTKREVGEVTGLSVTTIQYHLERGLEKLRGSVGVLDHA